uniref:Secreted protein n=2 Tax=Steinernema glaseri TaxID=37863 RepID=A0A1I7YWQ4_9BILA
MTTSSATFIAALAYYVHPALEQASNDSSLFRVSANSSAAAARLPSALRDSACARRSLKWERSSEARTSCGYAIAMQARLPPELMPSFQSGKPRASIPLEHPVADTLFSRRSDRTPLLIPDFEMRWLLVAFCCAGFFLHGTSSSVDAPVIEIVQDERIPDQPSSISEQNDEDASIANNKLATGKPSLVEYPITGSPSTPKTVSSAMSTSAVAPLVAFVLARHFL